MHTAEAHPLTLALAAANISLLVHSRPTGVTNDKEGWKHYAWAVSLVRNPEHHPQKLSGPIPYRMGIGHKDKKTGKPTPPKVEDVISSMTLDATACDESFDDWCSSLGYETDSRKALKTYLACQNSGVELRRFLRSDYAVIVEAAREW